MGAFEELKKRADALKGDPVYEAVNNLIIRNCAELYFPIEDQKDKPHEQQS